MKTMGPMKSLGQVAYEAIRRIIIKKSDEPLIVVAETEPEDTEYWEDLKDFERGMLEAAAQAVRGAVMSAIAQKGGKIGGKSTSKKKRASAKARCAKARAAKAAKRKAKQ